MRLDGRRAAKSIQYLLFDELLEAADAIIVRWRIANFGVAFCLIQPAVNRYSVRDVRAHRPRRALGARAEPPG